MFFMAWNYTWSQVDSVFIPISKYETVRSFDENRLEAYRSELNYQNDPKYINNVGSRLKLRFLNWLNDVFGLKRATIDMRFFLYLIMVGGLAVLFYYIYKSQMVKPFSRINDARGPEISMLDMVLTGESIEEQMNHALENADFALVLKLHYIQILKLLDQKDWILWKEFKTNGAYIKEIKDKFLKEKFEEITNSFEKIAYGEFPIDEEKYNAIAPNYIDLMERLKKM